MMVECPECEEPVWDIANRNQRLNKCWKCGTRFDTMDNDSRDPGEIWDELEYEERGKITDKFSGEWSDGGNVDNKFWEDLSEHDKEIIIIYFEREGYKLLPYDFKE
jgi:hypothetical protein